MKSLKRLLVASVVFILSAMFYQPSFAQEDEANDGVDIHYCIQTGTSFSVSHDVFANVFPGFLDVWSCHSIAGCKTSTVSGTDHNKAACIEKYDVYNRDRTSYYLYSAVLPDMPSVNLFHYWPAIEKKC